MLFQYYCCNVVLIYITHKNLVNMENSIKNSMNPEMFNGKKNNLCITAT